MPTQSTLKLLAVSAFVFAVSGATVVHAESAGQYVDDVAITTKVKAALISDQQLKAMPVSVRTSQGTVELTGTVDTKTQEAEAVRVANQVNGVQSVTDSLTVRSSQEQ